MRVRLSWQRGLSAVLLAAWSQGTWPAAGEEVPPDGRRIEQLQAEVASAQQARDPARLAQAFGELARLRPEDPTLHRGQGIASYLSGNYAKAVEPLRRAAELDPALDGARLYLGMSLYRLNGFEDALRQLDASPELARGQPVALYWKGASHRALGQLEPAILALEAARSGGEPNADLLQLLTRSYSERSTQLLRKLLSEQPDSAASKLLRAEELAMDGVDDAALRELDEALAQAPGVPGVHKAKGEILRAMGEHGAASEQFAMELEVHPVSPEASLGLAAHRLDQGDPEAALRLLDKVVRFRPDDHRVARLTALARRALPAGSRFAVAKPESPPIVNSFAAAVGAYSVGWTSAAASWLESALHENGGAVAPRWLLAKCHLAEGDEAGAVGQLIAILQSQPGDAEALLLAGKAYERLASETAEALFALNPNSASVRVLRGEAFERAPLHEFESALGEFQQAISLQPGDPATHFAAGRVLFKMKRFEEAAIHLEKSLALNRRHGMANYLLGRIHLANRRTDDAIGHLEAAVEARPSLADARRDLARAMVQAGRSEEAVELYRNLLRTSPGDSSLHALIAVAYRREGRMDEARRHAQEAQALAAAKHQGNPE